MEESSVLRRFSVFVFFVACEGPEPPPPECVEGRTACGTLCVLLEEDPRHCGGCGARCDGLCYAGICRDECPSGTDPCGTTCRALQSDPTSCGECDLECETGEECAGGECRCPVGLLSCAGTCVDPATDWAHCGDCDAPCAEDETCVGGVCGCARERRETECSDETDGDCDGLIGCQDPDCADSVVACTGSCGAGVRRCEGTERGSCLQGDGGAELCGNGIDDDCDGGDAVEPDDLEPGECDPECYQMGAGTDVTFEVSATTIDSVMDASDCYSFTASDDDVYPEHIVVSLLDVPDTIDLDLHLYRGVAAFEAGTPFASSMHPVGEEETLMVTETFDANESGPWFIRVVRVAGWSCDESYRLVKEGLD